MKIIKGITIAAIISVMMIGLVNAAPPPGQAQARLFAYIDIQKVLLSYEKAKKAQEQFMLKEQNLQDEIAAQKKQAKSRGASDEDIKSIEKSFESKKAEIMESRQKAERDIKKDISGAVGEVAQRMGIEIVVNKQALVYVTNWIDISDAVIQLLNKKK